jgi:FkbM family methyltransferase
MPVSLYALKNVLRAPRTVYKRRQEKNLSPMARSMLEQHRYGRAMYDFMGATAAQPDLLVDVDVDEHSVVLDVGAYAGEWSEQIVARYGARVYAFEPNPKAFAKLQHRLGATPNVTLLPYGLGGADQIASLALEGPGSSVFTRHSVYGTTDVHLRDVIAVLDELGLDQIDLAKVNIEGGEYDLFDRLIAADRLHDIRLVSVQFHEWHPHAYRRRYAIRRALARTHEEVWNYPWVWELWRRRDSEARGHGPKS